MSDGAGKESAPRRVGVIVVHGVGEAELGYSVNTLAYALKDNLPGYEVVPHSEIIRLEEEQSRQLAKSERAPAPRQFRVVRRHATHPSGAAIEMSELYWADLTNLGPGRLNSLMGMFRLIFESHHFVDAMLDRSRGLGTALLRRMLLFASWLMRGPIAALTVSASFVCALLLYGPLASASGLAGQFGALDAVYKFGLVQICLIAITLYGLWHVFRTRDASWYDLVFWLGVTAFALGGAIVWRQKGTAELMAHLLPANRAAHCATAWTEECYVNVPYAMIVSGWYIWGVLILASVALAVGLMITARLSKEKEAIPAICASVGVIVLQFMLWTLVVVTALFPLLNRGELVTGLSDGHAGSSISQFLKCKTNEIGQFAAPVCELVQTPQLILRWIGPFKFIYAATAIAFVISIVVMLVVLLRRWTIARRYVRQLKVAPDRKAFQEIGPEKLPRLVLSPWLLGYLMIAVVTLIFMILRNDWVLSHIGDTRGMFLTIAALSAVVLSLLPGHRLSNIIHISRDLLDHHYAPDLETAYYFFPSHFLPKARHPRRRRIHARLLEMLRSLVSRKAYDAVVFVAHSQGSVVVFDYLARDELPEELGSASIGLVTFGSPIGHIYENYFHEYRVGTGKVEHVADRVTSWINLTRVDDYIGGRIAADRIPKITNLVLGKGGHTEYWNVKEVVEAVDRSITLTASPTGTANTREVPITPPSPPEPAKAEA